MKVEIKNFSYEYWPEFVDLINDFWSKDHPIVNRSLFDWQYQGFGHNTNFELFKILLIDGKMEGFRGVIPGLYHVPNSNLIHEGGTFSMWLVTPAYRKMGMGYKLMAEIEKECSILMSVGSTLKTSGRIYAANNFTYLDKFHRWTIGFDKRYINLLRDNIKKISDTKVITHNNCELDPDPVLFEKIWKKYAKDKNFFSLYRSKDFWKWRYVDSPGFKYFYFKNKFDDLIVGRIESGITSNNSQKDSLKLFRFIEIIPAGEQQTIQSLISDVMGWAIDKDCCGADFQASNTSFNKFLISVGFIKQDGDYGSGESSLAGLFHPFKYEPDPINAFWRVSLNGKIIEFDKEKSHIMKSDNDMDRPNFWPVAT